MAQFSHPDFGGMSQWSPGMSMVGEMFNTSLKSKLDAVCTELTAYVAQTASTDQGRSRDDPEVSYRAARQGSNWWPVNPSSAMSCWLVGPAPARATSPSPLPEAVSDRKSVV